MTKQQSFPIQLKSKIQERRDEIALAVKPIGLDADRFTQIAALYMTQNSALWECDPGSLILAVMESARAGLMVDGKQAAVIPFKGRGVFMPMVHGIIALMKRSIDVLKIEARAVYDGDEFTYRYGLHPDLIHLPRVEPKDSGLTHAYAVMWIKDAPEPTFEVMTRDEIEQVRATSRNANHADSPWVNWYGEMARKTAVKRLSKYADLAPEAQRAIQMDHELFGDPRMSGYVEGLSEASRNQAVKSETEDRLAELKDRMEEEQTENGGESSEGSEDDTEVAAEPRQENQWERSVINFIADSGLTDNDIHARKILNHSPFTETPMGELEIVEAVAYVYGWLAVKERHPRMKSENRAAIVNREWDDKDIRESWIAWAISQIPPEEPSNG